MVVFDPSLSAVPAGALFTVEFDTCDGPKLAETDFICTVLDAADTSLAPVSGTTCSVALQ